MPGSAAFSDAGADESTTILLTQTRSKIITFKMETFILIPLYHQVYLDAWAGSLFQSQIAMQESSLPSVFCRRRRNSILQQMVVNGG